MAETKDVATSAPTDMSKQERQPESVLRPPVDIFEDPESLTLVADIPGVSKDRLNLQVERNTLLIEGQAEIDMAKGMEALYADVRSTRYQRGFTLSGELATDAIEANLKDGVLTIRIPKRTEAQPRKIEVQTG